MIPFFIAYPRSGNHWVKAMACTYFGKKKIKHDPNISYDVKIDDVLFFGGHELLEMSEELRVLYLYRNPDDVLYSLLNAERRSDVQQEDIKLRKHLCKFLLRDNTTCIKYEKLQSDFIQEFSKLVYFFNKSCEYDQQKALLLNERFSKANLARLDSKYMNKTLLSSKYQQNREAFRKQYGATIKELVITDDLSKYFE